MIERAREHSFMKALIQRSFCFSCSVIFDLEMEMGIWGNGNFYPKPNLV